MEKISICFPTRQRPSFLQRLWTSILETADSPDDLEMVIAIDDDDKETIDFVKDTIQPKDHRLVVTINPRERLFSKLWEKCYQLSTGDIIFMGNDDIVFRTKHWDTVVRKKFAEYPDHIALVYGRNGYVEQETMQLDGTVTYTSRFGTHPFVHRRWPETVGYYCAPYFSSDYVDTWLNDIALALNRKAFCPEILIEHMHFSLGKSVADQNTKDRLVRHQEDNVAAIYNSKSAERNEHIAKLQKYIAGFKPSSDILDAKTIIVGKTIVVEKKAQIGFLLNLDPNRETSMLYQSELYKVQEKDIDVWISSVGAKRLYVTLAQGDVRSLLKLIDRLQKENTAKEIITLIILDSVLYPQTFRLWIQPLLSPNLLCEYRETPGNISGYPKEGLKCIVASSLFDIEQLEWKLYTENLQDA